MPVLRDKGNYKREVHGPRRLLESVLSVMEQFCSGCRVALLKEGTEKVTDEDVRELEGLSCF